MTHTHVSAPTQYAQANGIRFANRRLERISDQCIGYKAVESLLMIPLVDYVLLYAKSPLIAPLKQSADSLLRVLSDCSIQAKR